MGNPMKFCAENDIQTTMAIGSSRKTKNRSTNAPRTSPGSRSDTLRASLIAP